MSEGLSIGTLTGSIALEDTFSPALDVVVHHAEAALDKVKSALGGFGEAFAIGSGVAIAAVAGVTASIVELGEKGSVILGVEQAYDRLAEAAGTTGDALRQGLSEGVKETVSQFNLMQQTSRLLSSGMKLTASDMTTMGEAARAMGKATGTDAAGGLAVLSGALLTGRTRGLAHAGILVDIAAAEKKFADSLGVQVEQLNDAGKLEAKRIGILQSTKEYIDRLGVSELTLKEKIEQSKVAVTEWMDKLEKGIASSPAVSRAFDAIGDAIHKIFGGDASSLLDNILAGVDHFANGVVIASGYVVSFAEGVETVWNFLKELEPIFEVIAVSVAVYYGALILAEGWTLAVAAAQGVAAIAAVAYQAAVDGLALSAEALAIGPLAALAIAAGAVYGAFKLGQLEPVSDFFQKLGLRVMGYSGAEADAMIATDHATKKMAEQQKQLEESNTSFDKFGNFVGKATDTTKVLADKTDFLTDKLTAHEKAVKALLDAWTGEGKKVKEATDAFKQLTPEQLASYEVQQALIPIIDKMIGSHHDVSDAMMIEYNAALASKQAITEEGFARLFATDLTLKQIEAQKEAGLSEENIATKMGVSVDAMKMYEKELTKRTAIEKSALDASETVNLSWATKSSAAANLYVDNFTKGNERIIESRRKLNDFLAEQVMTSTDYQVRQIWEQVRQQELAYDGLEKDRAEYNRNIETLAKAQTAALYVDSAALRNNSNETLRQIADKNWTTYLKMAGDTDNFSATAIRNMRRVAQESEDAANDVKDKWGMALGTLSQMFQSLGQASGGQLGQIFSGLGQTIVQLDNAHRATKKIAEETGNAEGKFGLLSVAFDKDAESSDRLAAGVAVVGAVAQGVSNVMEATSSHATAAGNAMGGAMAGMQAGAIAGPWGMAIGAAAGFITGLIRGKPEFAQVADQVGKDFGVHISEELAKAIAAGKSDFGGSLQASTISHLGDIIKEAGGLTKDNLTVMSARLHDVFSMIETHQMTIAQGTKVIDENWQAFTSAGTSSAGVLNKQLVDMIHLQDQFGTQSKAMADYIGGQAQNAATGFGKALSIPAAALKSYDELNQKQMDLRMQIDTEKDPKNLEKLRKELDDTMKKLDSAGKLYDITKLKSEGAAEAMGASIAATMDGMIKSGKTSREALEAVTPLIDNLDAQLAATGFSGGAAFDMLRGQVALAKDEIAGPALEAVDGLTVGMVALTNTGGMTETKFSSLASQVGSTFSDLVAQGKDGGAVMLALQPSLQRLWEEEQQFGYKVDDTTQALIDEAEKAGEVGEKHKSSTDQMIDALATLHTDLMDVVNVLTGGSGSVAGAFESLGSRAKSAIDKIPTDYKLNVAIETDVTPWSERGGDNHAALGGRITDHGVQRLAGGGRILPFPYRPSGIDTVPIMGAVDEGVITRAGMDVVGDEGLARLNRGLPLNDPSQPPIVYHDNRQTFISATDVDSFRKLMSEHGIPYFLTEMEDNRRMTGTRVARVVANAGRS